MIELPAPALYRMYLKTDGDRSAVERACLQGGFLGLGWGLKWNRGTAPRARRLTWERYIAWAESEWTGRETGNLRRFHDADGLVWTRTADGIYYLASFTGPWEYRGGVEHDAMDLSNVRDARIEQVGSETEVPGAVVRTFSRQGQAFCHVHDETAARYSALIWARLTGEPYAWQPSIDDVLDSLLSPFDVQDLVAAYLQAERGWLLFPSRLSDSTTAYEFVLRDPATGKRYVVQVKTGTSHIDQASLAHAADLDGWVIFSTSEAYRGPKPRHVEQLVRAEMLRFMTDHRPALPPIVDTWISTASSA